MEVRHDELAGTDAVAVPGPTASSAGVPCSISVVISGHNRGADIEAAIHRVRAQLLPAAEILVVDDGSTDDTTVRVARHRDHVRFVRQQRLGRVAAHNRGAELATGDWVAFFDFGAPWRDDYLARMAAAIETTGGAAGLYFADAERSADAGGGTHWQAAGFVLADAFELVDDAARWALLRHQPMNLAVAVFCRRRFVEIGGFDSGAKQRAADLFFRFALGGAACAVDGVGADAASGGVVEPAVPLLRRATVQYLRGQIALYRTALRHVRGTGYRFEVRHRLASAHWRLARAFWRRDRFLCAAWQFLRSAAVAPSLALNAIWRWRRRRGR